MIDKPIVAYFLRECNRLSGRTLQSLQGGFDRSFSLFGCDLGVLSDNSEIRQKLYQFLIGDRKK